MDNRSAGGTAAQTAPGKDQSECFPGAVCCREIRLGRMFFCASVFVSASEAVTEWILRVRSPAGMLWPQECSSFFCAQVHTWFPETFPPDCGSASGTVL